MPVKMPVKMTEKIGLCIAVDVREYRSTDVL